MRRFGGGRNRNKMNGQNGGARVRRAGPSDVEAIRGLLAAAFSPWASHYSARAFAGTVPGTAVLLGRLSEGPVWVAVAGAGLYTARAELVGTLGAVEEANGLYLRSLAVAPRHQGRGVGRGLIERAEAYAIARDHDRLLLSTAPFLVPAVRLYHRLGFVETEAGATDLAGTPLVSMEKCLRPRST